MEIGSPPNARTVPTTPIVSKGVESTEVEPVRGTNPAPPPLSNPALRYDITARVAVLTYYDESGDVKDQIPPKQVVELYRRNGLRKAGGLDESLLTPSEANTLRITPKKANEGDEEEGPVGKADSILDGTAELGAAPDTRPTGNPQAGTTAPADVGAAAGLTDGVLAAPASSGRISISV